VTKSGREIMEIFEAFDLTGTAWSAAQLTGYDAKTVARYVAIREAGGDPLARAARPRLIDVMRPAPWIDGRAAPRSPDRRRTRPEHGNGRTARRRPRPRRRPALLDP
jgi:hypothetical protein